MYVLMGLGYKCGRKNYQLEYFLNYENTEQLDLMYYKQLFDKYESEEELMNDIHYVRPRDNKMFF